MKKSIFLSILTLLLVAFFTVPVSASLLLRDITQDEINMAGSEEAWLENSTRSPLLSTDVTLIGWNTIPDNTIVFDFVEPFQPGWQYALLKYGGMSALYDTAQPLNPEGFLGFEKSEGKYWNISSVTWFTATAVPIPTTALLFGSALLCLIGVRMRRRGA